MAFRDQMLVCESCGKSFVFTVTEQRRLSETIGEGEVSSPARCPDCRQGSVPATAHKEPAAQPAEVQKAPEPSRPVEREKGPPSPAVERERSAIAIEDEFPLEEEGIQVKLIGTVKWFSLSKGYGFVTKADGEDLFFHRSDVEGGQSTRIDEGQQIEFQIRRTDKGLEAFNVSILPPA